ncbi:MAG: hypothetical protein KDI51_19405 [Xanthomonadales bacterium]|nr:hypothetical protein [Xanthomonadales bacterium]
MTLLTGMLALLQSLRARYHYQARRNPRQPDEEAAESRDLLDEELTQLALLLDLDPTQFDGSS